MNEGRTIQYKSNKTQRTQNRDPQKQARTFSKFMMEGKVRAAIRLITEDKCNGPLNLDNVVDSSTQETVRDILKKKHPPKQTVRPEAITKLDTPIQEPHPILFDQINGDLICSTSLKMDGAAGPSGLDAAAWKRLLHSFKSASSDLCDAIAATAR